MDNLRTYLFVALAVVVFLMFQAWQTDYASQPSAAPPPLDAGVEEPLAPPQPAGDGLPEVGAAPGAAAKPAEAAPGASGEGAAAEPAGLITVITDVYRIEIDLAGGDLRNLELLHYPQSKDEDAVPLRFLNGSLPNFFTVNSGLVASDQTAPTHDTVYTAERQRYRLAEGRDDLLVPLRWTDDAGREVTKTYRFRRGSYEIELLYALHNGGEAHWELSPYLRLWRTPFKFGGEPPFIESFLGVAAYEREDDGSFKFRKYPLDELEEEPLALEQSDGWIAMLQHYFVAAVLPPPGETNRFYARPSKNWGYLAEYVGSRRQLDPGSGAEIRLRLFLGPKLQHTLDEVAPGLNLTVDYGLLTAIAEPLFWVLNKLHGLLGNWGWAIVALTVLIKLVFYKLSEAQYRSMARMKKFAPRIQAIKERYADDRERLHKAMMELYQKEGFNPFAGCWPMLVQFPVFIALYWVLLESVELRQADFALWLNDLSSPDPYYVLPVLFGISMFAQQRLSGTAMTMEPMQQRIMNIMPVGLTVFFAFFPVGLVLYWLVSNLIGIAQQWYITRKLAGEDTAPKR